MMREGRLKSIEMFEYICTSMNKNSHIRSMTVIIYADDELDAENIFLLNAHRFFDQDLNIIKRKLYTGYTEK